MDVAEGNTALTTALSATSTMSSSSVSAVLTSEGKKRRVRVEDMTEEELAERRKANPMFGHKRKKKRYSRKKRKNQGAGETKERAKKAVALASAGDVEAIQRHLAEEKALPPEATETFIKDSRQNWNVFYKQKSTNFFKDRNYLRKELVEIMPRDVAANPKAWCAPLTEPSSSTPSSSPPPSSLEQQAHQQLALPKGTEELSLPPDAVVMEVGCGVGNTVFPLLRANPSLRVIATDFSGTAVNLLKANPEYAAADGRCRAFMSDVAQEKLCPTHVTPASVDYVTMIFMLSAVHPSMMLFALKNVHECLKTGGVVYFRDYGRYDLPQLRYPEGRKLAENFYMRGDGTGAHYFALDEIEELFAEAGFDALAVDFIHREIHNRKKNLTMKRVWVEARFQKK